MRKLTAILLAVVLCFGLGITASAAGTITGIKEPIEFNNNNYDFESVHPGTVVRYPLTEAMFTWSDGSTGSNSNPVTTSQLNSGKITIKVTGDTAVFKKISLVNEASSVTGNQKTATIKVEFKETFDSARPVKFRVVVYLAQKNVRDQNSRLIMEGTFEPEELEGGKDSDYVVLGKGKVFKPTEYVNNIELDLGDGVIVKTRVYSGRSYSGYAVNEITASDEKIMDQFPSIDHIIRLKTTNISPTGKSVDLSYYEGYHVYNAKYEYLGSSNNWVEFSDRYYLSTTRINMSNAGSGSSSGSNSGNNSGSSSGSNSGSTSTGSAVNKDKAVTQAKNAVATAKSNGKKTVSVRYKNYSTISVDTLRSMNKQSSGTNVVVSLMADTMSGDTVMGRLTIPTNAISSSLTGDIKLPVRVDKSSTDATKTKFEKLFTNKMAVVSLDHKGSFGTTVRVVAKVNTSGMTTNNLRFYVFDKSTGKYSSIKEPSYKVDANGYVYFNTTKGGDIIISNGALTKR